MGFYISFYDVYDNNYAKGIFSPKHVDDISSFYWFNRMFASISDLLIWKGQWPVPILLFVYISSYSIDNKKIAQLLPFMLMKIKINKSITHRSFLMCILLKTY